MSTAEQALVFPCADGTRLVGVLHIPDTQARRGVVIVVGGPQYRIGSHRQFVLLARHLANNGTPVLRFDYRGMGDSDGPARDFEHIQEDIRAALDQLCERVPTVEEAVLWGLCDAATASAFYAGGDPRVCGLVLVNPWVRSEQGESQAYLRHYYLQRLVNPDFWRKVLGGKLNPGESMASLKQHLSLALKSNAAPADAAQPAEGPGSDREGADKRPLETRMAQGLERFGGKLLLILSGNDLTAKEFVDSTASKRRWKSIFARSSLQRRDLADADHTFSRRVWRDQVAVWTSEWLGSW